MRDAVFQIPVIVLIRLRVNDDRMIDAGFPDELQIRLKRRRRRLIRGVRVIGKSLRIEQMDVSIDERAFACARRKSSRCREETVYGFTGRIISYLRLLTSFRNVSGRGSASHDPKTSRGACHVSKYRSSGLSGTGA